MNITCPHCHFSKAVAPDKVPDRPVKVNCPKCGDSFTFDKTASAAVHTDPDPAPSLQSPAPGAVREASDAGPGCLDANAADRPDLTGKDPQGGVSGDVNGNLAQLRSIAIDQPAEFLPKAGFWVRVVATSLDSILLSLVQFVLTLTITQVIGLMDIATIDDPAISMVVWLFGMTISLGYAVFFTGYCGQTPGKMALRIKVVCTDGSPIHYGRAAKREVLGKFVSSILLGIGYLMVAFDKQKQGLHDKIADTYVIKL